MPRWVVGRLGVLGARLDAVEHDPADPAVLVDEQDPERSDTLLRGQRHGQSAGDRQGVHRPAGVRAPGDHLPARHVDPEELLAGSLAGDREHALRADPAHGEPPVPADVRHAHRPPARDVHEVDARTPARAPAPRVREREPAPVRGDAQVRAADEGADRTPDLLERSRVQAKQQVAAVAVPHAHERCVRGCLLSRGGSSHGERGEHGKGRRERSHYLYTPRPRFRFVDLLYLLACKQPLRRRSVATSASCSSICSAPRTASSSGCSRTRASRSRS